MIRNIILTGILLAGYPLASNAGITLIRPLAKKQAPTVGFETPEATYISDYTLDGFTAHWNPVKNADKYLVNVYEKMVADAITIQDFDNLNIIPGTNTLDKSTPGFTEGWEVVFGTVRNADHITAAYEGTTGMIFRATGEGFITPEFERPIKDFSFYAAHPSGEECLSTLVFSVLVDGEWGAIGNYDVERISPEGEIIRLSSNLPEGVKGIKAYFRKNDQYDAGKDVSVVIDHIRILTDPETLPVAESLETTSTLYKVSGLDPLKDYSFTVRACKGEQTSPESNELTASGLPAPKLLEAEGVTSDSYIAKWASTPKAEGYMISNYRVYTVPEGGELVNILYENFDKVTEGTVSDPVGLYNVVHPRSLDDYTINPGWMGIATYLAEGMVGTRSYMGITGVIQTPLMDLTGEDGEFDVKVRVIGDTDATNEYLVVQAGYEDYDKQQISPTEVTELTYHFNCGEPNMALLLYSYNGFPLFIDEITVTQHLPEGAMVFTEVKNVSLEGNDADSYLFSDLEMGERENYAYRVFGYRDFMGDRQYSVSNEVAFMNEPSGIEKVPADANDAKEIYYTLDGRILTEKPTQSGIYIAKTEGKTKKIVIR